MNKIITTNAASGLPYVSGLIDLLSEGYQQITSGLAKAFIGPSYDPTKAYIIDGLRASTSGGSTNFTEGLVLFGNELFYSPAQSVGISPAPNVLIANIQEDFPGAGEPLTYEDGSTHNTGARRRVDMAFGPSGSGTIADYTAMLRILQPPKGYISSGSLTAAFPAGGGESVGFFENRITGYGLVGSGPEIGLNASNAIDGCVDEIYIAAPTPGTVITFVPDVGVTPVILSTLSTSSVEITTGTTDLKINMRYQEIGVTSYVFITTNPA